MSYLITTLMLVILGSDGKVEQAAAVIETNRVMVQQFEVCEEVAEANNRTATVVYSTDGQSYVMPYQTCERSL